MKAAERFVHGTEHDDPFDLLNETLARLAEGRRIWPIGVGFPATLIMCMKSLSSHGRRGMRQNLATQSSVDEAEDEGVELGGAIASVEETLLAAERHRELMRAIGKENALMAADPVGRLVFNGIISGVSAEEMQRRHRLSRAEYKAARQRAMRRVERVFEPATDTHCPARSPRPPSAPTPAAHAPKAACRGGRRKPRP